MDGIKVGCIPYVVMCDDYINMYVYKYIYYMIVYMYRTSLMLVDKYHAPFRDPMAEET